MCTYTEVGVKWTAKHETTRHGCSQHVNNMFEDHSFCEITESESERRAQTILSADQTRPVEQRQKARPAKRAGAVLYSLGSADWHMVFELCGGV